MQFIFIVVLGFVSFLPLPTSTHHSLPPPPKNAKLNWFLVQKHDSVLPQPVEDLGILM